MKAVYLKEFGGAEKLEVGTVADPTPGDGEVLVEVHAAGVNPVDFKIREGYLKDLFPHDFPLVLGWDVAGVISGVGPGVSTFKVGDRVAAYSRKTRVGTGSYAEKIVLPESRLVFIPKTLSFTQAASIPLTALTAYQGLFDFLDLKAGETLLVHAGAGGVGGMAVQMASQAGVKVLTTARSVNHDYVRSLGATYAIDYTQGDFNKFVREVEPNGVDAIFDATGGETLQKSLPSLKEGGRLVSIVEDPLALTFAGKKIKRSGFIFVQPDKAELTEIFKRIERGDYKVPEITELPLEKAAEAHRLSQSGRTRGKIVLKVR